MIESTIASLTILKLHPADRKQFGLSSDLLKLRRAWPRASGHLALEYITGDGDIIAGQWFDDVEQLERIVRSSPKPTSVITSVTGAKIILHFEGADRRLPGLLPLLSRSEAQLLVHRPERRAVVRLKTPTGLCYAKVVKPKRTQFLATTEHATRTLAQEGGFTVPKLLKVDVKEGLTFWSALAGESIHKLLGSNRFITAAQATGQTLRALHGTSPPANIATHNAADEIGVLRRWFTLLEAFAPALERQIRTTAAGVLETLATDPLPSLVPLHRDFYDKQIFIDTKGHIGLLDFDTLAVGEAALDLANALIHFELRGLQARYPMKRAMIATTALLNGYRPDPAVHRRLNVYADATRLRLACVYAFRPYGMPLVPLLLARVGQPVVSMVR